MGFSGSVNGTTKNLGFLDFGFCQFKWAYGVVGIIKWFTVHHVVDLKRSVCLFFLD